MKNDVAESEQRFIGFDLGAESGRCVVATLRDEKVSLEEVHRFTTHSVSYGRGFHWDILAIVEEIVEGLTKARKAFGSRFKGIGVDTWGVDYVLIDPGGRVLSYPCHYRDARTDGIMERAFAVVSKEDQYRAAGIQFMQFNTIFQLFAESESKLDLLTVADTMLLMPDFLNFVLSGARKAEFTIASTTALADPYTRNWCWQLIDAFGFRRKIFPPMVESGTRLGTLLPSIAEATGIDAATPVFASAGHDTASAVVSVPSSGGRWAYLSSGTWSLMGVELKEPLLTEEALKYNFTNEGGIQGTTRFLKNIIGLWPIQECRRFWMENGQEFSYAQLTGMAEQEGFVEAWVDLNDPRFLKPGNMPSKITSYLRETNQVSKESMGFIIRVVLESLAYCYRTTISEIEQVVGSKIETLHAVGGGIQNELLVQLTADALGIPVVAGPVEGTIVGNIGVQAIAAGAVSDLAMWRAIVGRSFGLKRYAPEHTAYFDEHAAQYRRCLKIA
jgi:rhamnulokinase